MSAKVGIILRLFRSESRDKITVYFQCVGVPAHLRGREFIIRNTSHLRVAEFQTLIKNHLECLLPKGSTTTVTVLSDTSGQSVSDDSDKAIILMTSVKPILPIKRTKEPFANTLQETDSIASTNLVNSFQYSVPFTLTGKSYAKEINQQWKRTTILYTAEFFPSVYTRQLVTKRETRDLNPVQVALEDIRDRVDDMRTELDKHTLDPSEINNLKRLVQGTVAPQVTNFNGT